MTLSWPERVLRALAEWPAAGLVLAEIVVLSLGVVYRYVLQTPLTWSDELASILFLWLAMLGAVVALQHGEHMRLTVFVARLSEGKRRKVESLVACLTVLFCAALLWPAIEHMNEQWVILTPALEIPDALRVAAVVVGLGLMLMQSLLQLSRAARGADLTWALGCLLVLGAALHGASPFLMNFGHGNLLLFFVLMVGVCVVMGLPIAFAFGLCTVAYLQFSTSTPLTIVVSRIDEGMSHLILLSVPLFVFLGAFIAVTGLAKAMVQFLASLLGHFRGGLQYVLLAAMYLVSGISGSKAADMAAVAPALFPEMKQRGADPGRLVALLAASGAMSETIPPSLVLITIGAVTGVSIAALFVGGLMPALVGMLALCVVVYWQARGENTVLVARTPLPEVMRCFWLALPALALPFVIRSAVVEGVATATEVSTIGILYTLIVGTLVYRQLDWRRIYPMLVETASLSGAILLIIGCATAMAWALTQSGFSRDLVALMTQVPGGAMGFMVVSLVVFVILGSMLEGIPAIVLFGPLLFPVARALGIHEVHYAMVVVFAMGLGLFAPPVGVGFYAACAIGKVEADLALNKIWPYLGALMVALLVIAFVPWVSIGFL
jgi:tripartite ATP-independent transporter DctM subunit